MPFSGDTFDYTASTAAGPSGTTISSTKVNQRSDDVKNALNTTVSLARGGTGATTAVGAADALSPDFVDVASATTTDIGAATSPNVNITGTTTIASFGTAAAGVKRLLKFAGALTLTHNATSLILFGTNITTAVGDVITMISEGSGNWRCANYQSASFTSNSDCDGRLTLTTGTPITTSDVSAADTLYFTPYGGNKVALYTGSSWVQHTLSELSIALSGGTASKPNDVFLDYNGGTPQLNLTAWTNTTTRATALALQDGVYVKTGATDHRYIGTIYIDGSNQCEDSATNRHVWNMYNRRVRPMFRHDNTDSWNYSTSTYRQANNSALNQFSFVRGLDEDAVSATLNVTASSSALANQLSIAFGLDSSTTVAANSTIGYAHSPADSTYRVYLAAFYSGLVDAGLHELRWLEYATTSGTTTWYGDAGGIYAKTGITGSVLA